MLIPVLEFVAILSAALFAGAALYVSVVEHPARMGLTCWGSSDQRLLESGAHRVSC